MKFMLKTFFILTLLIGVYLAIYLSHRTEILAESRPLPPFRGLEELPEGFTPLKIVLRLKKKIFFGLDKHFYHSVENSKSLLHSLKTTDRND